MLKSSSLLCYGSRQLLLHHSKPPNGLSLVFFRGRKYCSPQTLHCCPVSSLNKFFGNRQIEACPPIEKGGGYFYTDPTIHSGSYEGCKYILRLREKQAFIFTTSACLIFYANSVRAANFLFFLNFSPQIFNSLVFPFFQHLHLPQHKNILWLMYF